MAAWHFIKHLTLSRPLIMRISPSPLSVLKHHHKVISSHHHCCSSYAALPHKSSSTPYLSVLIHCSKDNAVIILTYFPSCWTHIVMLPKYLTSTCMFLWLLTRMCLEMRFYALVQLLLAWIIIKMMTLKQ